MWAGRISPKAGGYLSRARNRCIRFEQRSRLTIKRLWRLVIVAAALAFWRTQLGMYVFPSTKGQCTGMAAQGEVGPAEALRRTGEATCGGFS